MIARLIALVASCLVMVHGSSVMAQMQSPVRIAVIDSGVVASGPLSGHVVESYDMTGKNRTEVNNSHGTNVAGVVALNAKVPFEIISLRADGFVCGRGMTCQMNRKAIAAAFRKAIDVHADIIQISSYGSLTPDIRKAVAEATAAGIHVVFCAGNEGGIARALPLTKTAGPLLHIVGSLDANGRISKWSARDFGKHRRLEWRPGENVPSIDMQGNQVLLTGTSFAAPLLSAELASTIFASRLKPIMTARLDQKGPAPSVRGLLPPVVQALNCQRARMQSPCRIPMA